MEFFDNLMIRACKSGLPKEKIIARLLKIWAKRCNIPRQYSRPIEMFQYGLLELVEKYNPVKLSDFFKKMTPFELLMLDVPKDADTMTAGIYVCISHLRFTDKEKLPGYVAPLAFRKTWAQWDQEIRESNESRKIKQIV